MGIIQVQLPEQIQQVIDRQVAEGRVASQSDFLIEAARRLAEDLALEDEILLETECGIADAEKGRFVTIATPQDSAALHERTIARLKARLVADGG